MRVYHWVAFVILSGGLGNGEWVTFNKSFLFIASGLLGCDRTSRKADIACRNASLLSGTKVLHDDFMPNRTYTEHSLIYIMNGQRLVIQLLQMHILAVMQA